MSGAAHGRNEAMEEQSKHNALLHSTVWLFLKVQTTFSSSKGKIAVALLDVE